MNALTIVIVLALGATFLTMMLGIFTMGAGGEADEFAGERLMWARIVLQALTLVLMLIALWIH